MDQHEAERRRRVIEEGRATVDRLHAMSQTERPSPVEDKIAKWARDAAESDAGEAAADAERHAITDSERERAATEAWQTFIINQIRAWTMSAAAAIGTATAEAISERDEQIAELRTAIGARDRRLDRVQTDLATLGAEHARLRLQVAQDAAERGRRSASDWIPPSRRELN